MTSFPKILAAALVLAAMPAAEAREPAKTFRGEYSISLLGFPVARSSFTSTFREGRFKVQGSLASAGIARIFDSTQGTTSVSWRVSTKAVRPDSYRVDYKSGGKKKRTSIRFQGNRVAKAENVPPTRKRRNWIPVSDGDLRAVVDPLSATIVPADSPAEVCRRTIRVFDGEMRADLALSHVSNGTIAVPGYRGDAVTCRARFVPVSGYRKGRSSLEYMKNRSNITIAFAPLGNSGVYVPVHATVGTKVGTLTIQARRFEVQQ